MIPAGVSAERTAPLTRREDLLTVGGATWMMLGLFLDGYAHQNLLDADESFLSIYHAVFYSGFAASSWAVYRVARVRSRYDARAREWLPQGYGAAVVGLAIFATGGVSDGIWHSLFGIEKGIDALLSPSHLLLLVGALLLVTAPLRSAMARSGRDRSWDDLAPAVASMTLTLCLVGFFAAFMWGPGFAGETRVAYDPLTGAGEEALIIGVSSALVSTAVAFGGLGVMMRRWRLPTGAATVILVVPNTLVIAAFDYDGHGVTAMVVAAMVTEAMLARPEPERWWPRARLVLVVSPMLLWLVIFALRAVYDTVAWEAELWAGTVGLCGLTGAAVAYLLDRPPVLAPG